jgi:protein-S-isoprenylcysteine O-methyltransferase Ste14
MWLAIKNLLFTIFVPGTVAVLLPLRIASPSAAVDATSCGLRESAALLPLVLGAVVYAWCVWDFATFGHGTPAPIDAPQRLVVRGLYRYVRNPMYVGVLTVIAGWALYFGSWAVLSYGLAVALCFHSFVVFYEEPALQRAFGVAYVRYCHVVWRWVPTLPSRD